MNLLKLIGLTLIQLFKQACSLPKTFEHAVKQRQLQVILNGMEVERLDRIRNPEKYRGKEI